MAKALPPLNVTLLLPGVSHLVLPTNNTRTTVIITNLHDTATVFLGIGYPAELGKGCVLEPRGVYYMNVNDSTPQAINAISTVAGVQLSIQEMGQ